MDRRKSRVNGGGNGAADIGIIAFYESIQDAATKDPCFEWEYWNPGLVDPAQPGNGCPEYALQVFPPASVQRARVELRATLHMRSKQPPIVDAVLRGDAEELTRLLGERGANPDERRTRFPVSHYEGGETALWLAAKRGDVALCKHCTLTCISFPAQ